MESVVITHPFAFEPSLLMLIVSRISPALKRTCSKKHDVRERRKKQVDGGCEEGRIIKIIPSARQ